MNETVSLPTRNTRSLDRKISSAAPNQRSHVPKTRYQFYVDPTSLEGAHKNLRTGTRASASRLLMGLGEKTPYLLVANLVQKPVTSDKDADEIIGFREAKAVAQAGNTAPLLSLFKQLLREGALKAAQRDPTKESQTTEGIAFFEQLAAFFKESIEEFQLLRLMALEPPKERVHALEPPQKRNNEEPRGMDCFSEEYEEQEGASFLNNLPAWFELPYEQAKKSLPSFGVGSAQERLESALLLLGTLNAPKQFSCVDDYLSFRIDPSFPLWAQANSAEAAALSLLAEVPQDEFCEDYPKQESHQGELPAVVEPLKESNPAEPAVGIEEFPEQSDQVKQLAELEALNSEPTDEKSQHEPVPELPVLKRQAATISELEWFPEETDREEYLVPEGLPSWAKTPYRKAKKANPKFGAGDAKQRMKAALCLLRSCFPDNAHLPLHEQDNELIHWFLFNEPRLPIVAGLTRHEMAVVYLFYTTDPILDGQPSRNLFLKNEERLE